MEEDDFSDPSDISPDEFSSAVDAIYSLHGLSRGKLSLKGARVARSFRTTTQTKHTASNMVLQAIKYSRGSLEVLDQLALPHQQIYDKVSGPTDAWQSIRSMKVRGAPAIAIVAALALAVELHNEPPQGSNENVKVQIVAHLQYLTTSRPTAVNLSDAVIKLSRTVELAVQSNQSAKDAYIAAAEQMLIDDVSDNRHIGDYGAKYILDRAGPGRKVSVLTHCNTGSLATAGYGTALGIVRSLHASGRLEHVYYGETRPYNQGARLTGYELLHDEIPCTLVTDSMAGALMAQKGPQVLSHTGRSETRGAADDDGALVAVIVGADRVAANGDTANKIGTYALSVLAKFHNVAFIVAAPRTTIDLKTSGGQDIIIEERNKREVTTLKGPVVAGDKLSLDEVKEVSIAPQATNAWNPAFDVTPASLIDAIVTEVGVVEKDVGIFDLTRIFDLDKQEARDLLAQKPSTMPDPAEGP